MALYRKYRPASFAEVVGQEQVTRPLSTALDSGRINHAYLFSGPRGCGKTSSARILARSLNCVEGPTSTPCGKCSSCISLAPGGHGNLDVTELDAASHRGVDDMRELRDRAYFAPAESRYRVFIIDEAHMITTEGANALLKIVEEPPEHLIFIFATTEPEKIIGTIRSRTHHYPFRLLTPQAMRELLERTVEAEGVRVDDDVYPLIIRSGGGSPRDTLSLLDQLLAGSGPDGLAYDEALPLLGVTDLGLIDDTVNALAAGDGAGAFKAVDDVIEAGHEPRRFALDLLDRLRDLMVIQAVPDAFGQGLVEAPTDRAQILSEQAAKFTGARVAQLASEVNDRISSLRGATSPRLLLEIMIAHLLAVPAAPAAGDAASQRGITPGTEHDAAHSTSEPRGGGAAAAQAAAAAAAGRTKSSSTPAPRQAPRPERPQQAEQRLEAEQQEPQRPATEQQEPQRPATEQQEPQRPATEQQEEPRPQERPQEETEGTSSKTARPEPTRSDEDVFSLVKDTWTQLRQYVGGRNKVAEIMLTEARPLGMDGQTLVIGHNTGALAQRINSERNNADIAAAFSEKLGSQVSVKCIVGTDPAAAGFHHVDKKPEVWNPQSEQQNNSTQSESEGEQDSEPEPAPPIGAQTTPSREEIAAPSDPEQSQQSTQSAQTGWGAPARIPGQQPAGDNQQPVEPSAQDSEHSEQTQQPTQRPEQSQQQSEHSRQRSEQSQQRPQQSPQRPQRQRAEASDWKSIAQEAAQRAGERRKRERDDIPLPPEPMDDDAPPPPDAFDRRPSQQSGGHQASQQNAPRQMQQTPQQRSPNQGPVQDSAQTPEQASGQAPAAAPGQAPAHAPGQPSGQPQTQPPMPERTYSREDEEQAMADQAQEPGEFDRRDATQVAMELLQQELGAKPL